MAELQLGPRMAAFLGVGESDQIGRVPGKNGLQLAAEASRNALADAGIDIREVDALFTCRLGLFGTQDLCDYLGIKPRFIDSTHGGGSSWVIHVEHALAAMHSGLCDVALIAEGEIGYSGRNMEGAAPDDLELPPNFPAGQFVFPFGAGLAPGLYAMACSRHMGYYGTTSEQLAEIAVATRKWAALNPRAFMRQLITIDDVLNSPWICYPFHRLDCCLITDAGGAVVMARRDRVRSARKKPVWVLGTGEAETHGEIFTMEDYTVSPARLSGADAFKMAGLTHADVDVCEIYDSFTYTVLVTLESLGFCKPGEGGEFVSNQRTAPGGDFPVNTHGGGLSYTHPGGYGIFTLVEAARQLWGECGERQVDNAKIALCNGTGGNLSNTGTVILGAD